MSLPKMIPKHVHRTINTMQSSWLLIAYSLLLHYQILQSSTLSSEHQDHHHHHRQLYHRNQQENSEDNDRSDLENHFDSSEMFHWSSSSQSLSMMKMTNQSKIMQKQFSKTANNDAFRDEAVATNRSNPHKNFIRGR